MTKYSLDISKAKLGENGLAVQSGWIAVYSASRETREYIGVNNEYIALGVSLPADGYSDAPTLPGEDDKAVRRNVAGTTWEIVTDLRGTVVYSTQTGMPEEVTTIGELSGTLTHLAPQSGYDKWNGTEWVTDKAAQQAAATREAEATKAELLNDAAARIAPLQDAVDTELATDSDKEQLTAWKTYRVLLSRIDTSKAPDIEWPEAPQ
ncbi:tail fiber assembly protein [Yersinia kristensenii]|uniref:tail fiber assembly protein n=1 Tax=Yersinia kristensenii TaxID=28152 RepID=UPI001C610D75|nr:tail fiber assembly protein [Yersinia kristensenii]MBW5816801.1 tail fiber assembly protein [Yersinia kristensenii]